MKRDTLFLNHSNYQNNKKEYFTQNTVKATKSDEFSIVDSEIRLIDQLRHEAEEVKDCYTQFAFKAWTFVSAMVVLQLGAAKFAPATAFAAPLTIIILLAVIRIGQHKYATANRHFGFELYLNRRRRFNANQKYGSWQPYMRKIGWEEAQYAWRIVQASLYDEVYGMTPWKKLPFTGFGPEKLYRESCPLISQNPRGTAIYHAGGYLAKTAFVLHIFALFCLIPLLYVTAQNFNYDKWIAIRSAESFEVYLQTIMAIFDSLVAGDSSAIAGLLVVIMGLIIILRYRRTNGKRVCLESGLLSINSSAIVWNAVVIAHYRALDITAEENTNLDDEYWKKAPRVDSYSGYTKRLGEQASILRNCVRASREEGIYDFCKSSKDAADRESSAKKTAELQLKGLQTNKQE